MHRRGRKFIFDVYCFIKREANNNEGDNLKKCIKRTAEATKCSESTVRRIIKCSKDSKFLTVFRTPGKNKRLKENPITSQVRIEENELNQPPPPPVVDQGCQVNVFFESNLSKKTFICNRFINIDHCNANM